MKKKRTITARPDYDRAVFQVLHAIRHLSDKEVAAQSFVSAQTIRKWRLGPKYGGVRYPLHCTLSAVARVAGMDWQLVPVATVDKNLTRAAMVERTMEREMEARHKERMEAITTRKVRQLSKVKDNAAALAA